MTKTRATEAKPRRGRPAGPTAQAERTRTHLYETALAMLAERGFAATTLRDIADEAEVSVGLLYRCFPGKDALVLALYDTLSDEFAERASKMPKGAWADRFVFALHTSLAVLTPHRETMGALLPVLIRDDAVGLLQADASRSRER